MTRNSGLSPPLSMLGEFRLIPDEDTPGRVIRYEIISYRPNMDPTLDIFGIKYDTGECRELPTYICRDHELAAETGDPESTHVRNPCLHGGEQIF